MLIIYNILHFLLIILLLPVLCIYIAVRPKYRSQIPKRLGIGLKFAIQHLRRQKKILWIHALSVGEVTSALPLVAAVREEFADISIIFSSSTHSGYNLSKKLITPYCDCIIAFPLDISPICSYYIRTIKPDLFILVETDFWPNFLLKLHQKDIPALLVNGRISVKSMALYRRYRLFFKPLFQAFSAVCVQTESDRRKFMELGTSKNNIHTLGNLKYESAVPGTMDVAGQILARVNCSLVVAGSTHPGEESLLLQAFSEVRTRHLVKLIIAPRTPARAPEIRDLAQSRQLITQLRSDNQPFTGDILILDTIGELISFYNKASVCFVGGSLVAAGGHNPLEPASLGKPVIFGSDMSDFAEISRDLLTCGGAIAVGNGKDLTAALDHLLDSAEVRRRYGHNARSCVQRNQGIVAKHLLLLREFI